MSGIGSTRRGGGGAGALPDIVRRAGSAAVFAAEEFFDATIRNEHTRRAIIFEPGALRSALLRRRRGQDARDRRPAGADAARLPRYLAPGRAGHADQRTTRLYDRRDRKITRIVVERISI